MQYLQFPLLVSQSYTCRPEHRTRARSRPARVLKTYNVQDELLGNMKSITLQGEAGDEAGDSVRSRDTQS